MAQLLSMFKDALLFKESAPSIDSWTFKLFNKVTTPMMLLASVAVSARQFFGEPVQCDPGEVMHEETWERGERWFFSYFYTVCMVPALYMNRIGCCGSFLAHL